MIHMALIFVSVVVAARNDFAISGNLIVAMARRLQEIQGLGQARQVVVEVLHRRQRGALEELALRLQHLFLAVAFQLCLLLD